MLAPKFTSKLADLQTRSKATDVAALITLRQAYRDIQELSTAYDNYILAIRSH